MAKDKAKDATATAEAKEMTLTAVFEKDTKRTYRYNLPEDGDVTGALYVQKSSISGKPPVAFDVTVKMNGEGSIFESGVEGI